MSEVFRDGGCQVERDRVIATLRAHEADLRRRGIVHAALFGSTARGTARPDSDVDILIEIDPEAHLGVWGYAGLKEYVAGLFPVRVDVASREGLKALIRPNVERDAVYAF